jgi:anti-anti-sigma factor
MQAEGTNSANGPEPWAWLVAPDGRTWPLAGDVVTCGRARDNALVLEDESVSRRHARFERRTEGYVLTDLGSANGTHVNEDRVSPTKPRLLRDGDRLTIGAYPVTLRLRPRAAPAAPRAGTEGPPERRTARLFIALPEVVTRHKLVYVKICAQGVLNSVTTEILLQAGHWAIEQNVTRVLIDAAGVDSIDSAGIGGLVRLQRQLNELGGGVAIAAPSPSVRQILELMNLSGFLPMFPDEGQAVAAVSSTLS